MSRRTGSQGDILVDGALSEQVNGPVEDTALTAVRVLGMAARCQLVVESRQQQGLIERRLLDDINGAMRPLDLSPRWTWA